MPWSVLLCNVFLQNSFIGPDMAIDTSTIIIIKPVHLLEVIQFFLFFFSFQNEAIAMLDGLFYFYSRSCFLFTEQLEQIKRANLARILCDNSNEVMRMQKDVFSVPDEDL
jgi:hypothetical protein